MPRVGARVRLYRLLALVSRSRYSTHLTSALSNRSKLLAQRGDMPGALALAREAEQTARPLAVAAPQVYGPVLLRALAARARCLLEAGHPDAARGVLDEARMVAEDGIGPVYVRALSELSTALSLAGRRKDALDAARMAVAAAEANDATELPAALSTLGIRLGEADQTDEAVEAQQRAVDLFRRLPARLRATRLVEQDGAERWLAIALSRAGRHEAALRAAGNALASPMALVRADPAVRMFHADLLQAVAYSQGELGRHQDALETAKRAADLIRGSVSLRGQRRYKTGLANALTVAGTQWRRLGRPDAAVGVLWEAVELIRDLPDVDWNLVSTMSVLSDALWDIEDRRADALRMQREVVPIARQLATVNPRRYTPVLAQSLLVLAQRAGVLGVLGDAAAACDEALEIAWRLVYTDPVGNATLMMDILTELVLRHLREFRRRASEGRRFDRREASDVLATCRDVVAAMRPLAGRGWPDGDAALIKASGHLVVILQLLGTKEATAEAVGILRENVEFCRRPPNQADRDRYQQMLIMQLVLLAEAYADARDAEQAVDALADIVQATATTAMDDQLRQTVATAFERVREVAPVELARRGLREP